MNLNWLLWKFILRRAARAHGFLDPAMLIAHLRRFAQPSEVAEPIELLRAGVVFHARGLINSRVIQHNLDWVWPYWVERQFDPRDVAFVPRAFSITHVNLTHRNWTALGWPDCEELPIVDPRGLFTPLFDGWSLDGWIVTEDGRALFPSRVKSADQRLEWHDGLVVSTESQDRGLGLTTRAEVARDGRLACRLHLDARADAPAWLALTLRPYNPEGVSFIHEAALADHRDGWTIGGHKHRVEFSTACDRHQVSNYGAGDVRARLHETTDRRSGECDVGMLTAAALFRLEPGRRREISAEIPLTKERARVSSWRQSLDDRHCRARLPDARFQFLYDAALRTLILHSPGDVWPGPYTYKRFWFRDASFIIHALLCVGLTDRAERALDRFPSRQTALGYFHSQHGEWDSNGEALWILHRFCELTGRPPKSAWRQAIEPAARWIHNKRLPDTIDAPHSGLLPAGFSAEHFGPNDYYYWDDFWGIAGLRSAAWLMRTCGDAENGALFERYAAEFTRALERSLRAAASRLGRAAMPASPHRRLDAGAIGGLAAGYPLQAFAPGDPRLLDTVEFLLDHCFVDGGFFQDMVHSGINPYLTLHVAQVLLRAGDRRYFDLMQAVARLASPTGQWPEAIHPHTGGGCMGDGQHVWAAAEWVIMVRNLFVREEDERLILASGIPPAWLKAGQTLGLGPAPTSFGTVTVTLKPHARGVTLSWQADWHGEPPVIEIRLPGFEPLTAEPDRSVIELGCRIEPSDCSAGGTHGPRVRIG